MKNERQVLYVQTSDQPERQYTPLVMAQAAKAMDLEPVLFYIGMGLHTLVKGRAEKIDVGTYPNLSTMLDRTIAMGIPIYVCEASRQLFGWDSVELMDGVIVAGAATLNDLALDAAATFTF
ncbi:MAG: sulfur reduction protein DsrE [Actinobacteria bacterium HGW-Actinobacteria-10]|nr:MAG: sulfur reduction protein DsrE [Actinobacteria bacterium HGW-Actinobacteria-10]